MASLDPFIHFNGNAEEAFTFYRSVFGGEFSKLMRYKDIEGDHFAISECDANRLMHITLPIGKTSKLLSSDVLSVMGQVTEKDNRNTIYIIAESREEADQLFKGLSQEGTIEMPIADGPMGSYFGMFTDKFGIQWMIEYTRINS